MGFGSPLIVEPKISHRSERSGGKETKERINRGKGKTFNDDGRKRDSQNSIIEKRSKTRRLGKNIDGPGGPLSHSTTKRQT